MFQSVLATKRHKNFRGFDSTLPRAYRRDGDAAAAPEPFVPFRGQKIRDRAANGRAAYICTGGPAVGGLASGVFGSAFALGLPST
jgi:hypothetical protein